MYKNFQCRNVQEMKRSIVKHCTPRSQIMWNVTLNSSYTSPYIINVDQNKKRKQSPRMRRRDCNLPLTMVLQTNTMIFWKLVIKCPSPSGGLWNSLGLRHREFHKPPSAFGDI